MNCVSTNHQPQQKKNFFISYHFPLLSNTISNQFLFPNLPFTIILIIAPKTKQSNTTENECFDLQLLGGPTSTTRNEKGLIQEGTKLVLYNFQSKVCYLPITALTNMQNNFDPNAWGGKYPCQVKANLSECGCK